MNTIHLHSVSYPQFESRASQSPHDVPNIVRVGGIGRFLSPKRERGFSAVYPNPRSRFGLRNRPPCAIPTRAEYMTRYSCSL